MAGNGPPLPFESSLASAQSRLLLILVLWVISRWSEPAANLSLVAAVVVAELRFEIALFAGDHLRLDRDQHQGEQGEGDRPVKADRKAGIDKRHAEIHGIAGPPIRTGRCD